MLSVLKASQRILKNALTHQKYACDLSQSLGYILREDIYADRAYPPFDKALMDGIAIASHEWRQGKRVYKIMGVVPAGKPSRLIKDKTQCVSIMTGAVVPQGFDCIVPIEQIDIKDGYAQVKNGNVRQGQFIRYKAQDIKKGAKILSQGQPLTPAHIGILASVGKKKVIVTKPLNMAIISSGDELVDVGRPIKAFQTRTSNAYAIKAAIEQFPFVRAAMFQVKDNKTEIESTLKRLMKVYDVIILSGGVSKGAFDYIPQVLQQLKVHKVFHGVAQKPGGPFWFGVKDKKPIFALPGNPASSLVCVYQYIIPYIYKVSGHMYQQQYKIISEKYHNVFKGTIFIPISNNVLLNHGGSGDFIAWAAGDGFIAYDQRHKSNLRPYFSWRI